MSLHTWGHPSTTKKSEALTLPRGWTLRTQCSVRGADTEGHKGCDSTNKKHPEQDDPQTQSGLLVVRGWGGADTVPSTIHTLPEATPTASPSLDA